MNTFEVENLRDLLDNNPTKASTNLPMVYSGVSAGVVSLLEEMAGTTLNTRQMLAVVNFDMDYCYVAPAEVGRVAIEVWRDLAPKLLGLAPLDVYGQLEIALFMQLADRIYTDDQGVHLINLTPEGLVVNNNDRHPLVNAYASGKFVKGVLAASTEKKIEAGSVLYSWRRGEYYRIKAFSDKLESLGNTIFGVEDPDNPSPTELDMLVSLYTINNHVAACIAPDHAPCTAMAAMLYRIRELSMLNPEDLFATYLTKYNKH